MGTRNFFADDTSRQELDGRRTRAGGIGDWLLPASSPTVGGHCAVIGGSWLLSYLGRRVLRQQCTPP